MNRIMIAAASLAMISWSAVAAEPVVGSWKTASGETAKIAPCGGDYCITVTTGKFKGKQIGKMSGSGADYEGEILDPQADKTYSGSAKVGGASLKLTGCALKIFCKSQTWSRL